MSYKPRDLQAFEAKMKEINATKETDPEILRRMIKIERDQAGDMQASLMKEIERKDAEIEQLHAFLGKIASGDLYGDEAIAAAHKLIIRLYGSEEDRAALTASEAEIPTDR